MSIGTHTNDHEIKIGTETKGLKLIRDDTGRAMYQVIEDVPQYRNPLLFTQENWIGGHGQYDFAQPDVYFEGESIDTTQEGKIFLGPKIYEVKDSAGNDLDSAPVCFCWFNAESLWLCATSGNIYRYVSGKWTVSTGDAVTGVTHFCEFEDIMYAARGSSLYYYSADGIAWTATDLSDGYAEKFIVCPNPAGTADTLRKFKTPNDARYTTNGQAEADGGVQWSSAALIGDISNNITNMFLVNDNLMIGKEDNLFHYDSDGGLHPLRPDLKYNRSADNFKYVTEWQTGVYHSEIDGMGEITSYNAYEPMGPLTGIDDIGKRGDIVGLTSDKDYIYVAVDEGTNTHIYKGREVRRLGKLRWEWCPWVVFLSTKNCVTMKICQHDADTRYLWFGYGVNTAYVIVSDNPLADASYKFESSGWLRMSYDYGTDPNWDKLWQSAVLGVTTTDVSTGAVGATTGETVQVQYRKDAVTAEAECIAVATTNGIFETNFTSALNCNRIQFEIHLASNTPAATPAVSYFQAKGVEKPTTVRIHEATYAIGDTPSKRAETIRTFLRGGRTSTTLIKFADLRYGQSTASTDDYVWVVMDPGFPREVEVLHQKTRAPELGIQVRMKEVSFTIS